MIKHFFILKGNNGASYIVNTKNWKAITYSLKFYKVRTSKTKLLKEGLCVFLFLKKYLFPYNLKSSEEINPDLQNISKFDCEFNIDANCSVLISPTNDKVIVHHHHEYFQKFAFGKSYLSVKKEAEIYKLFKPSIQSFQVSHFFDEAIENDKWYSFKLSNADKETTKKKTADLVPVLVEFFKTSTHKICSVNTYINELLNKIETFDKNEIQLQVHVLEKHKKTHGTFEFPLGLVHRDFKPWNLLNFEKPLIFDFEEAIIDGPPLEDLLNFYVDPIIRYKSAKKVAEKIVSNTFMQKCNTYLKKLDIKMDFTFFLNVYLIERMLFWKNAEDTETSNKYLNLSNYFLSEHNFND